MTIARNYSYLFSASFTLSILLFSNAYLYNESNLIFKNDMRLSFEISFVPSTGFILYAIDTDQNRLLIKTSPNFFDEKEIICNFNGKEFKVKANYNATYSVNQLNILLKIKHNNLYIDNGNEQFISNIFQKKWIIPNTFIEYPIPTNYYNETNKFYIWIGNIGPYKGYNNAIYQPLNQSIIGCLDNLYINFKEILFEEHPENRTQISKRCLHRITEISYKNTKINKNSIIDHSLNCALLSMNINQICYKDLAPTDNQIYSYDRTKTIEESVSIKFIWKQRNSGNNCLIKLNSNMGSIIFYTSINDSVIMIIKDHDSTNTTKRRLFTINTNIIHILLINIQYSNIIIKFTNGAIIKTYFQPYLWNINEVNLQYFSPDICMKNEYEYAFRYDLSQWKRMIILNNFNKKTEILIYMIVIGTLSLCLILSWIIFIIAIKKSLIFNRDSKSSQQVLNNEVGIISSPIQGKSEYECITDETLEPREIKSIYGIYNLNE